MSSSKKLVLLLIPALVGCSKGESKADHGPSPKPGTTESPVGEAPSQPDAPALGTQLCLDATTPCSSYALKLAPHAVAIGLQNGKVTKEIINKALPNVLNAQYAGDGLTFKVTLPIASTREDVEIVIPADAESSEYALASDERMIITAINESSSKDLYAFAQKSKASKTQHRIKITFVKITDADRKAAGTKEPAQRPVSLGAGLSQSSVRGSQQEVEIAATRVFADQLTEQERAELKQNREMKKKYPDSDWQTFVTVYFQDGEVKAGPQSNERSSKVREQADYCFVQTFIQPSKSDDDSMMIGGVVTLVTGTQSYGPVDGTGKPAPNFEQTLTSGLQNTGAASYVVPGKGYNKFGNGRRDNKNLVAVGCTSKKPEAITVNTLVKAIGGSHYPQRRVSVTYPRADVVEAYLDDQNGVDLDLGAISYRWKRLDRFEGAVITVLKDIESPKKSDANAGFQSGQPFSEINLDGGATCYIPNHLKAGTKFTLTKAWSNTVTIQDNPPVSVGAVFTTDNSAIERITVNVTANWMSAPAKVTENPSLLDAQAVKDCFGDYVAISQ